MEIDMPRANGVRGLGRVSHWGVCVMGTGLLCALLAACSGSTGPAGTAGAAGATGATGPPGPTATGSVLNVSTATAITGKITSVSISGPPVVKFQLTDQNGALVQGLPAADLGVAIAQLVPGQNGSSSQWNSYIYSSVTPSGCPSGAAACDSTPQTQASVESATAGTLVDNGDGTYQYTFKKDITKDPNVVYNAALTHRVGFEIRGLAQANNASFTFQPSTGATTGIFSREVVDTATCNGCHTQLSAHGGARVEVQYCVMCHNPGTTDPYSGNSLDMKVMVHKLHTGSSLPTLQTASSTVPTPGVGYWIVGYKMCIRDSNETGQPLSGLTAGEIYFAVAKLVPAGTQLAAVPPQTAAPAPLVSSQWQSYIYTAATPAPTSAGTPTEPVVGTTPQPQATIEAGTAGTFVDNGDGTYQYKMCIRDRGGTAGARADAVCQRSRAHQGSGE